MISQCPGAKQFRQPEPEPMRCPGCGEEIELWTDEAQTQCPKCKKKILRQSERQSCLDWCRYAKECVGLQVYEEYMKNKKKSAPTR